MRSILLVTFFGMCLVMSAYCQPANQRSRPAIFESPYDLRTADPHSFYNDETTQISYRALGAETFSIVIYDDDKKLIQRFTNLKSTTGVVIVKPYTLKAGSYTYALEVNGRVGIRKKLTVLDSGSRPTSSHDRKHRRPSALY